MNVICKSWIINLLQVMVHRRMCQLSLTKNDIFNGLAQQTLESLDGSSLEDGEGREGARAHYSDDESGGMAGGSGSGSTRTKLKSIRSEPLLKKKAALEAIHSPDDEEEEEYVTPQQSTADTDIGVHFVASTDGVIIHFSPQNGGELAPNQAAGASPDSGNVSATGNTPSGNTGAGANSDGNAAAKNLSVC